MMKKLWIALTLIVALTIPAAAQSAKTDPMATARQYTTWFYGGEADRLWEHFSDEMKKALGSAEGLKKFHTQVADEAGTESAILDEKVTPMQGLQVYIRKAKFSKAATPVIVQWALKDDGTVAGFFVRPEPAAP